MPVIVNGSDEFPSFYSRRSGLAAPRSTRRRRRDRRVHARRVGTLGLTTGISVANPIPVADEIPADEIQDVIDEALAELDAPGIAGQDVTPFLLGRIVEHTGGRSLTANMALVRNNAVAAQIAVAYAELTLAEPTLTTAPVVTVGHESDRVTSRGDHVARGVGHEPPATDRRPAIQAFTGASPRRPWRWPRSDRRRTG